MMGPGPIVRAVITRLNERWDEAAGRAMTDGRQYGAQLDVALRKAERVLPWLEEDAQHYPVCYVVPGYGRSNEQTGNRVTREQEVVVIWIDRRDNSGHLAEALYLAEAAIIDALTGAGQPEPPIYSIVYRQTQPGPLFELSDDAATNWQSWFEITFTAMIVEEES